MYRVVFLLCLIQMVTCHWDCSKHSCHRNYHHDSKFRHRDRTFEHLAKQVIHLDKKSKELCVENLNNNTVEDYSKDDYKVIVTLPGYKEEDITVKLKHRALFVSAEKEVDSNPETYFEARIVPEVANKQTATWDLTDGKLEITFPYKEREEYATETCNLVIDETVKTVPKYTPNLDIRLQPTLATSGVENVEDEKINKV